MGHKKRLKENRGSKTTTKGKMRLREKEKVRDKIKGDSEKGNVV